MNHEIILFLQFAKAVISIHLVLQRIVKTAFTEINE